MRLGHIAYSNCYPVHARLLEPGGPAWIEVVSGTPTELNRALASGGVDVAPASSIEFARCSGRYRVLPGLSISSRGAVRTIVLASNARLRELGGAAVALPTASATSAVLLKILLQTREGVRPRYVWFQQGRDDPFEMGAAAALYIGDVALAVRRRGHPHVYDLGAEWTGWTGLPFVFALWQTPLGEGRRAELRGLHGLLEESLSWAFDRLPALAEKTAREFGWAPAELEAYWRSLDYGLDETLVASLERFYRLAAEIGEVTGTPALRFVP